MGRSYTPRYSFRIITVLSRAGKVCHTPMIWRKEYGRPTTKNIDKWVTQYEESCKPGGCNAHLGHDPVVSALILDQHHHNNMVSIWIRKRERPNEPLFQVI